MENLENKAEASELIYELVRSHYKFLNRKAASKMFRCCVSVMLQQSFGLNENLIKFTHTLIWSFTLKAS